MLTPMSKIEIIGSRKHFQDALDKLQSWGKLHLQKLPIEESTSGGPEKAFLKPIIFDENQARDKELREELKKTLEEIINHIPKKTLSAIKDKESTKWIRDEVATMPPKDGLFFATSIQEKVRPLVKLQSSLLEEQSVVSEYERVIKSLLPLISKHEKKAAWGFLGIIIDKRQKDILKPLEEQLEEITRSNYALFPAEMGGNRIAAMIGYEKRYADGVKDLLLGEGISELRVPAEFKDKPFEEAIVLLRQRLQDLPKELEKAQKAISDFFLENGPKILALRNANHDQLLQYEATINFAHSRYIFVIKAWVPTEGIEELKSLLTSKFHGEVLLNELTIQHGQEDQVPVTFKNRLPVRAFENLIKFFSIPMYGTIDPSALVCFFFPLFFGIILGDVGYGGVLGLVGIIVYFKGRKKQILEDIAILTIIMAISSIFFGFIYGEFFGEQEWFKPAIPQLARAHVANTQVVMNYLLLTVNIGLVHIVLALFLGILVSFKRRHTKHAIEGIARLGVLIGIFFASLGGNFLVIPDLMNLLPRVFLPIGLGMAIVSLPVLVYTGGFVASLELISLVGNVLSYARLMALGMASVAFTMVAIVFKDMFSNVVLGMTIFAGVHLFNLLLHVFTPTIQSLRLLYVEFFTKFFVPGGRPYEPFRKIGGE
ncbi:MAG TPA: V-type ATP synthase subunit I [Candidatus Brocadiia bacterium]|nr:hypothetical protein [Planctomycetota bacterium]MDO8094363.1 V-type ATPase 116kDa subunit family protein [Candidatus Brocadiales bacterium]